MKYIFTICVALFLFLGCTSDKKKLQDGAWIGKYVISTQSYGTLINDWYRPEIHRFDNDSLQIKYYSTGYRQNTMAYEISDSFYSTNKNGRFGQQYKIYNDSLLLIYDDDSTYLKRVYEKIPFYNQAQNKEKFYQFLTNASFHLDYVNIDFNTKNQIFVDWNLIHDFYSYDEWRLEVFDNELFLLIDQYHNGIFIHIKEINDYGFVGITYGLENKTLEFKKVYGKVFNKKQLFGTWKAISQSYRQSDTWEAVKEQEIFSIGQSGIIKIGTEMYQLDMNKIQNLRLIPNTSNRHFQNPWRIIELDNSRLMLERENGIKTIFEKVELNSIFAE